MNQNQIKGAQERIRYHTHEMLALFTAFLLLSGWIGRRAIAGEYDILLAVAVACALGIAGAILGLRKMVLKKHIKRMEEAPNG